MGLVVNNILDMLDASGEEAVGLYLSTFSCPLNREIEFYIQNRAIDFARRKLSITYVISDEADGEILGYFALAHKAIEIAGKYLSNTTRKKLERYSSFDKTTETYTASAFLLAQIGKNYSTNASRRIRGKELMGYANDILADIQRRIGGGIVYLDCEDNPKLTAFYEKEVKFKHFGERHSGEEGIRYLQYMRFLG